MKDRKAKTAADFVKELEADEEYVARMAHKKEAAAELERVCAADEGTLVQDLRAGGFAVSSVWDFVNGSGAPAPAVATLVRHLDLPHHPRIWDGIVRALSTQEARAGAFSRLTQLYGAETDPARRWVLANALGSMAKFKEVADLPDIQRYKDLFDNHAG